MAPSNLAQELEKALPQGVKLSVRHVACPPTLCAPLFAPPPGDEPEPTYCEDHFLAVSIRPSDASTDTDNAGEILVLAIEVLVYTTARLTTVFVSKADSTGYLHLLNQLNAKSLTRNVFTVFLSHLLRQFQRPGVRLVLSLFARAQAQYLFPGSIDNNHKHLLDDRGLIKWWCRVFDPLLRDYEPEKQDTSKKTASNAEPDGAEARNATATAYLIIPGCDKYETKAFFPLTARSDSQDKPRWLSSYPLHQICATPGAPPRCLVPRFPDDPKARFLRELDDEVFGTVTAANSRGDQLMGIIDESATSFKDHAATGRWLSVRTLEQFWEMMTFRQECSAGRLVGFLWMIINPPGVLKSDGLSGDTSVTKDDQLGEIPDAIQSESLNNDQKNDSTSGTREHDDKISSDTKDTHTPKPTSNSPFTSANEKKHPQPTNTILLTTKQYFRLSDYLLDLDFADQTLALSSTKSWLDKLSALSGRRDHGETVTGTHDPSKLPISPEQHKGPANPSSPPNNSLISQKRKREVETNSTTAVTREESSTTANVNVLNATLIRKKKKTG